MISWKFRPTTPATPQRPRVALEAESMCSCGPQRHARHTDSAGKKTRLRQANAAKKPAHGCAVASWINVLLRPTATRRVQRLSWKECAKNFQSTWCSEVECVLRWFAVVYVLQYCQATRVSHSCCRNVAYIAESIDVVFISCLVCGLRDVSSHHVWNACEVV